MRTPFILLATLLSLVLTGCGNQNADTIHVFIWSDYLKPELIERFRNECDCNLVIDTYDSNEAMYAKLKLGGGGYDVIFPSSYFMEIMAPQGMLSKIDVTKLPNLKNLDEEYLKKIDTKTREYGVPYMVSSAGIIYRKDRATNLDPSWNVFNNAEYRGRMTMLNDIREVIGAALQTLGYSINTTNPDEVKKATDLVLEWKKNLAKFEGEQYKNGIASAEYIISQGYNGDSLQVVQENKNVAFAYPKEGISLAIDFAAIPSDAPNPEMAHRFIDFLLNPEVAAENMEFTYFLSPNAAAYPLLPPELASNEALFPPKEILDKAEMMRDLGDANALYNRAWDKIKAD